MYGFLHVCIIETEALARLTSDTCDFIIALPASCVVRPTRDRGLLPAPGAVPEPAYAPDRRFCNRDFTADQGLHVRVVDRGVLLFVSQKLLDEARPPGLGLHDGIGLTYARTMVQSQAKDVDGYLAEVPEERREALTRLRELCRMELRGFTEVMAYGMPAYEREGIGAIGFASQKQHISFYLLRSDVREAFAERLSGLDMGKGCLRFRAPEKIDFVLLRDLLRATAAGPGKIC